MLHRTRPLLVASYVLVAACGDPPPPPDPAAPSWRAVTTDTRPPARWGHVAVLDARRDRVLVWGGASPRGRLADLWAFSLASESWTHIPTRDGPTGRFTAAAVVDPARDRMVLVGGDNGAASAEVWALDLATHVWTQLPRGPGARFDLAAATDGQRAWFYAGFSALLATLDDLWELDLARDAWRRMPDAAGRPPATSNNGFAFHQGGLYVTGGHDAAAVTPETWRYDLAQERWTRLSPAGAAAAGAHYAYASDPECGVLWVLGGDNNDYYDVGHTEGLLLSPDAPRFARLPAARLPPPRRHAVIVFDPRRAALVLFGGWQGMATMFDDTWIYAGRRCPS